MTPEEALAAMQQLYPKGKWVDIEVAHGLADDLMCQILRDHGYGAMVDFYENQTKWYA